MGLWTKLLLVDAFLPDKGPLDVNKMPEVSDEQLAGLKTLLSFAYGLDQKPRRGWVMRDIENPETVTEHSQALCHLAVHLAPLVDKRIDPIAAAFMAINHDIIEYMADDITPHDTHVSAEEKKQREHAVINRIEQLPTPNGLSQKVARVWREFEEGTTPTAIFVRQLDKMQLGLQTGFYEETQNKNMPDMWAYAKAGTHHPALTQILNAAFAARPSDVFNRPFTHPHPLSAEEEAAALAAAQKRSTQKFIARMERAIARDSARP